MNEIYRKCSPAALLEGYISLLVNLTQKCLYNYAESNGLKLDEYNSYGKDYSDTLTIWKNEFNKKWDLIKDQGYDLTFKKMWEFYFSYCVAGFKSKNIDSIQFSLQNK